MAPRRIRRNSPSPPRPGMARRSRSPGVWFPDSGRDMEALAEHNRGLRRLEVSVSWPRLEAPLPARVLARQWPRLVGWPHHPCKPLPYSTTYFETFLELNIAGPLVLL